MIQNTFGYLPEYIVADACYDSEQNYMAIIDDFNKTPLITYGMFIKDKTRKFKSDIFNTQNWKYDELNDEFICPNNKRIGFKRYMHTVMIDMVLNVTSNYMNAMTVQHVL